MPRQLEIRVREQDGLFRQGREAVRLMNLSARRGLDSITIGPDPLTGGIQMVLGTIRWEEGRPNPESRSGEVIVVETIRLEDVRKIVVRPCTTD